MLAKASGYKIDLDSLLKDGKDAYTLLRYAYEGKVTGTWGLNVFSWCVRKKILSLHPEWKTI